MTHATDNPKGGVEQGVEQGVDRLRGALTEFLGAQAQRAVDAAGSKITDVTGRLTDIGDGGRGGLAKTLVKEGLKEGVKERLKEGVKEGAKKELKERLKKVATAPVEKVKEAVSKAGGGGKGGRPEATNIIEVIDVGVARRICYNHWTQYERFSDFTKGVQGVNVEDETKSDWKLKIGPSNRSWKATVQRQVPDELIEWTSEGAKSITHGVVTFHELGPRLTRIVVAVEYFPSGFLEKTANLWRAQGRRLRLDLKHFQRYVSLVAKEVPEGWRGEIRDAEVVRRPEEEETEEARDEPEEAGAEEAGAEGEAEGEGPEDEYDEEDEYEEEGEEDEEGVDEDEDEEDER